MLKTNKSTILQGFSQIDGVNVIFLSVTFNEKGIAGNVYRNIQNVEIYNDNRTECRQDISDFEDMVYELEDEMGGQSDENQE